MLAWSETVAISDDLDDDSTSLDKLHFGLGPQANQAYQAETRFKASI